MSAETGIAWTDATFNPWWGCQRVSPGCTNCYAETWAKRWGVGWGPSVERRFFGDKHWNEPVRWNKAAEAAGVRKRVFCASMADVFEDRRDLDDQRVRLWRLIRATPRLDWQLLTKRPENLRRMLPWTGEPWANVWLGTTCEDQQRADERIPHLLATPAAVRFLSVEPQLGAIDLLRVKGLRGCGAAKDGECGQAWCPQVRDGEPHRSGRHCPIDDWGDVDESDEPPRIHWVIVGGESGPGARPFHVEWARSIVAQCKAAEVPVFVKQLGAVPIGVKEDGWDAPHKLTLLSKKGGDMAEWPSDLRVREFPAETMALGGEG